jgi:hypothetical protein
LTKVWISGKKLMKIIEQKEKDKKKKRVEKEPVFMKTS